MIKMKRLLSFLTVIALCLLVCGCEDKSSFPTANQEFYVNDFANVLSAEDENEILSKAVTLNNKTTAQVVVVTVDNLGGYEIADYALKIGRDWGVGSKESNNGVVILLSLDEREIYISVGYGLEGALPDSKTGRIIDRYGLSYLKQDDFSKGITAITTAVINEIYIEYGMEPDGEYTSIDSLTDTKASSQFGKVIISWIILVVIIILFSKFFGGRGGPFIWLGGPGFRGSFGGGFRGGSGGFRGGFGGGGSFGGGGAGRGF